MCPLCFFGAIEAVQKEVQKAEMCVPRIGRRVKFEVVKVVDRM